MPGQRGRCLVRGGIGVGAGVWSEGEVSGQRGVGCRGRCLVRGGMGVGAGAWLEGEVSGQRGDGCKGRCLVRGGRCLVRVGVPGQRGGGGSRRWVPAPGVGAWSEEGAWSGGGRVLHQAPPPPPP